MQEEGYELDLAAESSGPSDGKIPINLTPLKSDRSPYGKWLYAQRSRMDPIGGFAGAAAQDPTWPGGHDIDKLRNHLHGTGARPFVLATFEHTLTEFNESQREERERRQRRAKNKVARASRKKNRRKH